MTRKIATSVAKIKLGLSDKIVLGNLDAQRDWGYAPEYVEAMWRMMQQTNPDDYVVATGETHSVREFLENACNHVGINYEDHLIVDKGLIRPLDLPSLKGDYSKIREACDWNPRVKFKQLVELMVDEEMQRWNMLLRGKTFPWDAPNYPSELGLIVRNGGNGR